MTIHEFIQWSSGHSWVVLALFTALPVVAWLFPMAHPAGQGGAAPWKYVYSALVYLACVPGMFSSVLTAYSMFFRNENLLDVNLLVYLLPIVAMIVILIRVHQTVGFEAVPGFDRLSGLMILIACSFGIALAVHKTRLFVGFFGSIEHLLLLAGGVFALLKWSAYMLFRRRDQPAQERPKFPSAPPSS